MYATDAHPAQVSTICPVFRATAQANWRVIQERQACGKGW